MAFTQKKIVFKIKERETNKKASFVTSENQDKYITLTS